MTTVKFLDEAMKHENADSTIILGDLNINLMSPKDERSIDIAEVIETYDMRNLARHFKCRMNKPVRWTWRKYREGNKMEAICDYILHGCLLKWKNFKVVDLPFDTDHRLIKGKFIIQVSSHYRAYMRTRKSHHVDLFDEENINPSEMDKNMKMLHDTIEEAGPVEAKDRSWILKDTFLLLTQKARALRANKSDEVHEIGKALRRSLRRDRRDRIWKVSTAIEEKLQEKDIVGAFDIIKHWYKKFTGKAMKPSEVDLANTRENYVKLFTSDGLSDELPFEFEYE